MTAVTIEQVSDKRIKAIVHNDTTLDVLIKATDLDPGSIGRRSFSFLSQPGPAAERRLPTLLKSALVFTLPPGEVVEREYDLNLLFNHPSGPVHMYVPVRHSSPDRAWWAVSNVITI
ncbi:hypothetical protein [Aeromicrobium sp. 179-A 4D2 NHS]|uniref:hypothetical protein n=1 Tax=Aeromicrobium sp. 179-A 4D2 NHS TaxID=3142375 RepID=UPI0039A2D00C